MTQDTCWETRPKAGWDDYVRARDRFLAQARPGRPAGRDETSDESTRLPSQPPRRDDVGLRRSR